MHITLTRAVSFGFLRVYSVKDHTVIGSYESEMEQLGLELDIQSNFDFNI